MTRVPRITAALPKHSAERLGHARARPASRGRCAGVSRPVTAPGVRRAGVLAELRRCRHPGRELLRIRGPAARKRPIPIARQAPRPDAAQRALAGVAAQPLDLHVRAPGCRAASGPAASRSPRPGPRPAAGRHRPASRSARRRLTCRAVPARPGAARARTAGRNAAGHDGAGRRPPRGSASHLRPGQDRSTPAVRVRLADRLGQPSRSTGQLSAGSRITSVLGASAAGPGHAWPPSAMRSMASSASWRSSCSQSKRASTSRIASRRRVSSAWSGAEAPAALMPRRSRRRSCTACAWSLAIFAISCGQPLWGRLVRARVRVGGDAQVGLFPVLAPVDRSSSCGIWLPRSSGAYGPGPRARPRPGAARRQAGCAARRAGGSAHRSPRSPHDQP